MYKDVQSTNYAKCSFLVQSSAMCQALLSLPHSVQAGENIQSRWQTMDPVCMRNFTKTTPLFSPLKTSLKFADTWDVAVE